jgi:cytochrome c2
VPGTKMVYAGLPSAQARKDVIAYLATLKKR